MMGTKAKAEANEASARFDARIAALNDWRGETLARVRNLIREAVPDAVETLKWGGTPVWEHNGILCTGEIYKTVVKLTFAKGASLKDPKGLFNASLDGAVRRAIDIREGGIIPAAAFKVLMREAVKANAGAKNKSQPAVRSRVAALQQGTAQYNDALDPADKAIADLLANTLDRILPEAENKIWHAVPVWFLDGNPVAGYGKLKHCVRLLFWSGQSFDEPDLRGEGSFKAAEARYTSVDQVSVKDLERWAKKSRDIQWDYKNIVKRRGTLVRLK